MKMKILGLMFLSAVASAAFTDFTRPAKAAGSPLLEERSWVVGSQSVRRFYDDSAHIVCYVFTNSSAISCVKY